MYVRRCFRNKDGKRHAYWALVEYYRTERGPRQRAVSYLDEMDAAGRIDIKAGVVEAHQQNLLLGRNTRAAGLFEAGVADRGDGYVAFTWTKRDAWRQWSRLSEGCYLLRINVTDWTPEEIWRAYIQLTEAEAAFRIQKSDLQLRPVWHQKRERVEAHILVCFLSYVLWKTLGQFCARGGLGDEPRKVFDEIAGIAVVDVVMPTRKGVMIRKRCVAKPTPHQEILLQRLGLRLPASAAKAAL